MKYKAFLISIGLIVSISLEGCKKTGPTLSVESIDNKRIYIGEEKSCHEPPPADTEARWTKTVNALNQGWEWIGIGNSHYVSGQYEEAVEAYKKAHEADPGNIMAEPLIIEMYEKLYRYDEAINLVDNILKTQSLAPIGVERYTAIRNRLLTTKNKAKEVSSG